MGFSKVKIASKKARYHLHDKGMPDKHSVYVMIFFHSPCCPFAPREELPYNSPILSDSTGKRGGQLSISLRQSDPSS